MNTEPPPSAKAGVHWWPLGFALLFLFLYLPVLPHLSRWRGDERFYTDATVHMLQSGDYLTPYHADGSVRFRKPILTYWVVAGSYRLMGIHFLSSRLPFLVAGALCIWLTAGIASALFRDRRTGVLAAAIFASNCTVFHLAIRSTPDILLCLFTTACFCGFIRILFLGDTRLHNYILAYFGAALAVATKGLAGLLPVLFVWLYARVARRRSPGPEKQASLLNLPLLIPALAIALSWYVISFCLHGRMALSGFMNDQVADRLSISPLFIAENLARYLFAPAVQFLPWSLAALTGICLHSRAFRELWRDKRPEFLFILAWFLMLLVVFTPGNIQRTRYFITAYPLLSALCAAVVLRIVDQPAAPVVHPAHRTARWIYTGTTGLGILILVIGCLIDVRLAAGGIMLTLFSLVLRHLTFRTGVSPLSELLGLAALIMVMFATLEIFLRPVFSVSPAAVIAERLASEGQIHHPREIAMAGLSLNYSSQLRVTSRGRIEPILLPLPVSPEQLDSYQAVVCTPEVLDQWRPKDRLTEPCGFFFEPWKGRDYVDLILSRNKQAVFDRMKVPCLLVLKESKKP